MNNFTRKALPALTLLACVLLSSITLTMATWFMIEGSFEETIPNFLPFQFHASSLYLNGYGAVIALPNADPHNILCLDNNIRLVFANSIDEQKLVIRGVTALILPILLQGVWLVSSLFVLRRLNWTQRFVFVLLLFVAVVVVLALIGPFVGCIFSYVPNSYMPSQPQPHPFDVSSIRLALEGPLVTLLIIALPSAILWWTRVRPDANTTPESVAAERD